MFVELRGIDLRQNGGEGHWRRTRGRCRPGRCRGCEGRGRRGRRSGRGSRRRTGRDASRYRLARDAQDQKRGGEDLHRSRLNGPSPRTVLVHLPRADGVLLVIFRLFRRILLRPEDHLAVLDIDDDRVALLELAGQHLLREWVEDETLERALERTGTVDGVPSLLRHEGLRGFRELEVDLPLR